MALDVRPQQRCMRMQDMCCMLRSILTFNCTTADALLADPATVTMVSSALESCKPPPTTASLLNDVKPVFRRVSVLVAASITPKPTPDGTGDACHYRISMWTGHAAHETITSIRMVDCCVLPCLLQHALDTRTIIVMRCLQPAKKDARIHVLQSHELAIVLPAAAGSPYTASTADPPANTS